MAASDSKRPTYVAEAVPSDVKNSVFLGNAALDNVVSCLIAMGSEVWATKRRMKVMEALLAKNGIKPEDIEKYVPTKEQAAEWERDRDRFIDLTLGYLGNEGYINASTDFADKKSQR